jgi:hypothetical protein
MKKLVAPGVSLITSHPRFGKGRRFQKWHTHSAGALVFPIFGGASGTWYSLLGGTLKDGTYFLWPHFASSDIQKVEQFQESYRTFISANGYVGFQGEWFNCYARGLTFDKFSQADQAAWLAAH